MKIPLVDLKAQYENIREEVHRAIQEVLESQHFILGPKVESLESALAAYLEVRHVIGVSSGTDALLTALWALGIGRGDRVVVPAYSFFATAGVVVRLGALPVFTDIDPVTYNMDPARLKGTLDRLTKSECRTVKALVPVHLYGQSADMGPILAVAKELGTAVVEDAAQAIGTMYLDGRRAGTMGTLGCFSFFPSKNLGAYGDAGLVATNDEVLAGKIRLLRTHGAGKEHRHELVGGNFRLDALQAAILLAKLPHLEDWTRARRERSRRYHELFTESGLTTRGEIQTPRAPYDFPELPAGHTYHQYVIRATERDRLRDFLTREGISTGVYYPVPFHLQDCFRDLGHRKGDFPEAERAANETLALPIYPEITAEQQACVVDRIVSFFKRLVPN